MNIRLPLAALALLPAAIPLARAAAFTWDPNGTPLAPTGGTGTWSTASANWSNGSADVVWTNATGAGANDAVITASSTLALGSAITVRNVTSAGTTTLSGGTLTLDSGSATNTGSGNAGPVLGGSGTLTISSVIAGSKGLGVNTSGTVVLSGANTYTGNTLVSGGTLRLGADNALTTSTSLITFGSGRTFDMNGFSQTVASIQGSNGIIRNTGASASTLTINGSANTSSGQSISNAIHLVKQGSSTLTLSGSGSLGYTGATTISGGTLRLSTAGSGLTGTSGLTIDGGTLASVVAGNLNLGVGHVSMSAGAITPGQAGAASSFTLAANQNFTATGGTLNFDVGAAFDQILGSGTGAFSLGSGASLALTLGDGFDYNATYALFSGFASGSVAATFTITGYDTGNYLALLGDGTTGALGVLSFSAVPEPSACAALAGIALLGFAAIRRRRA